LLITGWEIAQRWIQPNFIAAVATFVVQRNYHRSTQTRQSGGGGRGSARNAEKMRKHTVRWPEILIRGIPQDAPGAQTPCGLAQIPTPQNSGRVAQAQTA